MVSEISLGTVELGLDYGIAAPGEKLQPPEQKAAELLHFALDRGVTLIDTARAYGAAESIIGRAIAGRRDDFVLASKVRPQPGEPEAIRKSVEQSLRELRTDRIDVMLMHCIDGEIEPDPDTLGELIRQREAGHLRYIGSSVYGPQAALAAIHCGAIDCVQVAYSPLDRRVEESVLPEARRLDVGVVLRSVLLKGALTERFVQLPEALAPVKECAAELAAIAGGIARLPQLAYRYVLSQEPPHTALVGTASRTELEEAIAAAEMGPPDAETLAAIRRVTISDERWLNPGNWPPL